MLTNEDSPPIPRARFRHFGLVAIPHDSGVYLEDDMREYARAIEREHGIGGSDE